jgi:hypothetical protein
METVVEIQTGPEQESRPPSNEHRRTPLEGVAVVLGIIVLIATQLVLTDSLYLFRRFFWLDEIYTRTITADPDWLHSMRALAGGVETHPPTFYWLVRLFTLGASDSPEIALRQFALLCMVLALAGMYANLRMVFGPLAACAGMLALWSHGLVVHHAFEGRSYGAWLAASIWFAFFLTRSRESGARASTQVFLGLTSVLLCTIHYFGVISWGLIAAADWLFHRQQQNLRWQRLLAAITGPLALIGCVPILASQRAAMTVPTWVALPSRSEVFELLTWLLLPASLTAMVVIGWFSVLISRPTWGSLSACRPSEGRTDWIPPGASALAGMTALVLLPFVLVVVSFTLQPVWVDRYGLPAVAALAPAATLIVARMSRTWGLVACLFLALASTRHLKNEAIEARERDARTQTFMDQLRAHRHEAPVLFEMSQSLYVVHYYAPDLADATFALDFEAGQYQCESRFLFVRDLWRRYAEFYHEPKLIRWEDLQSSPQRCLLVVGLPWNKAREPQVQISSFLHYYPGYDIRPLEHRLFELVPLDHRADRGTASPNTDVALSDQ